MFSAKKFTTVPLPSAGVLAPTHQDRGTEAPVLPTIPAVLSSSSSALAAGRGPVRLPTSTNQATSLIPASTALSARDANRSLAPSRTTLVTSRGQAGVLAATPVGETNPIDDLGKLIQTQAKRIKQLEFRVQEEVTKTSGLAQLLSEAQLKVRAEFKSTLPY